LPGILVVTDEQSPAWAYGANPFATKKMHLHSGHRDHEPQDWEGRIGKVVE
jgi:hypothetical protein